MYWYSEENRRQKTYIIQVYHQLIGQACAVVYLGPFKDATKTKPVLTHAQFAPTPHFIKANYTIRNIGVKGRILCGIHGVIGCFFGRHLKGFWDSFISYSIERNSNLCISKMARCRWMDKYLDFDWLIKKQPIRSPVVSRREVWFETVLLILPADKKIVVSQEEILSMKTWQRLRAC